MLAEVLGFLCGAVMIGTAWGLVLRHERWKAIRIVYGSQDRRASGGNALIWPSR